MDLVVDANIIMSAMIATERRTFDLMFNNRISMFAPEYLMGEFEKHISEINQNRITVYSTSELIKHFQNNKKI